MNSEPAIHRAAPVSRSRRVLVCGGWVLAIALAVALDGIVPRLVQPYAMAGALSFMLPRGKWVFLGCAALLGLERVGELAHYPSDVVVGAALGLLAFHLVRTWLAPMLLPPPNEPADALCEIADAGVTPA